ncbi:MAG: aldehyde dehydrogenase family protein, partial [Nocardioides sp.]
MSLDRDALFIGGEWTAPASAGLLEVISPHSEEVVATVPQGTTADIDAAVAAARRAFDEGPWPRTSPRDRIAVLEAFSALYAARLGEMADLITTEMGSPTTFANLAQAPAPWMQIEAFLGIARDYPWEETRTGVLG